MTLEYEMSTRINDNLREVELLAAQLAVARNDSRFTGLGELAKMLRLGFYDLYAGRNPNLPTNLKLN